MKGNYYNSNYKVIIKDIEIGISSKIHSHIAISQDLLLNMQKCKNTFLNDRSVWSVGLKVIALLFCLFF